MLVDKLALLLVIVGALNWGGVGLFDFNAVAFLCGSFTTLARIIYTLVGFSGLWCITLLIHLFTDGKAE